ncbi:hypothetical protein HNE05_03115 [Aquipseudomonas campi]|uniref:Alpha/beta hydrolase n=1 Tax=Aquipseudomonas campi TaxID=2731681 RepID=A0A6M8FNU7_9GAMM|nr:hypothetical protein [Pseudomonas campi]QKE62388.1 hypothetical protein HNE05_03115 [Pseudomonas campi]
MDLVREHIIHSRGGRLGTGASSKDDASRIAAQAFKTTAPGGIALHFHGGLVSSSSAQGIAARLTEHYQSAGAYPLFFVWESGLLEAIRNNLKDILQDKVFHELLKKASEWVLKKGTGTIVTRGSGQTVEVDRLRRDFDLWLSGQAAEPPIRETAPPAAQTFKNLQTDEEELANEIAAEIELDPVFEQTIAGLAVASQRVASVTTRGAGIEPLPVQVLIDAGALEQMLPHQPATTKGGIPWLSVARFVAKVVIATLQRYLNKRDHGAYTTIVEEVLRAAYLDKVGQVIWNQMKKDAGADAFGAADAVGDVVLQAWKRCLDEGTSAPRITLIGHSTGAIYINAWLRRSAQLTPGLKYDLVLLAPACRTEEYVAMLSQCGAQIGQVRMFAMQDAVEQQDRLVPILYPRSLLYFVSGVVEGEVDIPLLGMQRFLADPATFDQGYMNQLRQHLDQGDRAVWSIADLGPGKHSASVAHGDFDNDAATLDSLAHILSNGFN